MFDLRIPYRMNMGPNDLAWNAVLSKMYKPPRGPFLYPNGLGRLGFSCGEGYVACKNSDGADICVLGSSCGGQDFPGGANDTGGQCQDFYTWTRNAGMEDCTQYCNSAGCNQDLASACEQRNNARSIAIQQVQQRYGDCVPPGVTISISSSGQWSATQGGSSVAPPNSQPGYVPPPTTQRSGGTLRMNTSRGSGGSYQVGDTFTVSITGATSNSPVTISATHGGVTSQSQLGVTDGAGNFSTSGIFDASTVGSWTEQWFVGGLNSGNLAFSISGTQQPANNVTPPQPVSMIPTSSGPNYVPQSAGPINTGSAGVLGMSNNTLLIAGAAVAVLLLMRK